MIASIRGIIQGVGDRFLIVETGGIGYQVYVIPAVRSQSNTGAEILLFTHHHVTETADELYGFLTMEGVAFYEQLLSISNVGPKTALNVMSVATIEELTVAIQKGDPSLLTKVSGVGKKTAERIVLELREKIAAVVETQAAEAMADDVAVLDALVSLGYRRDEARAAVRKVPATVQGVSERVREALRHISPHGRSED